jgi:two-component system, chemotaxis family, chemotaxis protein CheY
MKLTGKVLVVDDEAHIRKFVSRLVMSLGDPEILQAVNGEEAIKVYERERPVLVLLDVNMPRVDGIETLRRLKRFDPDCVVIMLTSLVNRQTVEECLQLGAVAYLRKDNPPDDMAARMKKIVDDYFDPKPANPGST